MRGGKKTAASAHRKQLKGGSSIRGLCGDAVILTTMYEKPAAPSAIIINQYRFLHTYIKHGDRPPHAINKLHIPKIFDKLFNNANKFRTFVYKLHRPIRTRYEIAVTTTKKSRDLN